MCEDWEGLSSKGWEKLETVKKGKKRLSYKTPLENGIRRVVNGPHQLKKHELKYVSILFPKSNLSKKRSIDLVEHNNETNETSIDMEPPVVSSLDSSSIFNPEMEKMEKERETLENCAERLVPGDRSVSYEVGEQIKSCVGKLNEMIKDADENETIVTKINADVLCCLTQEDNPFTMFPWDTSKNIFSEILNFGIQHTPIWQQTMVYEREMTPFSKHTIGSWFYIC